MENGIALPPPAFRAANLGPLRLADFGLTTVVLSCVNADSCLRPAYRRHPCFLIEVLNATAGRIVISLGRPLIRI